MLVGETQHYATVLTVPHLFFTTCCLHDQASGYLCVMSGQGLRQDLKVWVCKVRNWVCKFKELCTKYRQGG